MIKKTIKEVQIRTVYEFDTEGLTEEQILQYFEDFKEVNQALEHELKLREIKLKGSQTLKCTKCEFVNDSPNTVEKTRLTAEDDFKMQ